MAKYTLYPGKDITFTSKQGKHYIVKNKNGKLICLLDNKKVKPTKEILSRFTVSGGKYTIYTDGCCEKNPDGRGGYGVVIIEPSGNIVQLSDGFEATTNNRMEIIAAIEGIKNTPRNSKITLYSDSKYLINTMQGAYTRNQNHDLWMILDKECKCRKVRFEWVKGHAGNHLNEVCDKLAKAAITDLTLAEDTGHRTKDDKVFAAFPKIKANADIPAKGKINKSCSNLIDDFYNKESHSFKDYARLKTGGKDYYSEKNKSFLQSICGADINEIEQYVSKANSIYVLRWHCRGLSLKDSIIKVLVDNHISKCADMRHDSQNK